MLVGDTGYGMSCEAVWGDGGDTISVWDEGVAENLLDHVNMNLKSG